MSPIPVAACTLLIAWLVLCLVYYRQFLRCAILVENGRLNAPRPSLVLFTRGTKEFLDFVLKGRFRTSTDREVVRAFSRLRALLIVQLSVMLGVVLAAVIFS